MTVFQENTKKEQDRFQAEMDPFRLSVDRSFSGHFLGRGAEQYLLTMWTRSAPVKGNKTLIEKLERSGFCIVRRKDIPRRGEPDRMVFYVRKNVTISTGIL